MKRDDFHIFKSLLCNLDNVIAFSFVAVSGAKKSLETFLGLYLTGMPDTTDWDFPLADFHAVLPLHEVLTHILLGKVAAISQTVFSDAFLWMKILYLDQNFIDFFPKGPIDNNPALV